PWLSQTSRKRQAGTWSSTGLLGPRGLFEGLLSTITLEELISRCVGCRGSTSTRPFAHLGHVHCQHGTVGRFAAVLRVLVAQQHERPLPLLPPVEHPGAA